MKRVLISSLLLVLSFATAEARKPWEHRQDPNPAFGEEPAEGALDADVIRAVNGRKRLNFVEGSGMVVTKVLPDDTKGLAHQKFQVRLTNGVEIQAVYNLDMCPRVPVKVGDTVSIGGMFLWLGKHGMIHWLHHDPKGKRPAGYVELNGKFYCKDWR